MKDLELITYLRNNLKFGCIRSALFSECEDADGVLHLTLHVYPFRKFFPNDLHYIRCNVLESIELRQMSGFTLKTLSLTQNKIMAVYKFS